MLLSCEFSNFKSFRDPVIFELAAPKNRVRQRYPDNYVAMKSGELVLKDAVIAGENAGGKSNFVAAFSFLKSIFSRNDVVPRARRDLVFSGGRPADRVGEDGTNGSVAEQRFSIEIAFGQETIRYTLQLDEAGVALESLERRERSDKSYELVFKGRRSSPGRIREGAANAVSLAHPSVSYSLETGRGAYDPGDPGSDSFIINLFNRIQYGQNLLAVSLATLGNRYGMAVTSWFTSDLVIASRSGGHFEINGLSREDLWEILQDPKYFEIFNLVDRSIVEVRLDKDRPFEDSVLVRRSVSGDVYERAIRDDSTGVAQFAQWATVIYLVVHRNKTVFADEIDSAINPVLSDRVMAYINGHEHTGQFIFTTHNVFNLTFRTFMKEQMYFVTKDAETLESTLYSLADFKDVRYDVKGEIYDLYIRGMLGGTLDG